MPKCVALMLGEKTTEWADVRKLVGKADFISSILNYDAEKLPQKTISLVRQQYLDGNENLTVEKVMRSSKAAGPLYQWAESQVKYSSVVNRIQPLRDEVAQLEKDAKVVKNKLETVEAEVSSLETSIAQYKSDYATLIRDVEALKTEMQSVTTKVHRAESLLKSLGHESERWEASSKGFQASLRNLVGDCLLYSAFLTYCGFFDFKTRHVMNRRWMDSLERLGIEFHEEIGMVESLSKASDRLTWKSQGLPGDQLSLENGVILEHAIRFPLLIDPSGTAINFMMKHYEADKIQKTSFLDKAFTKTLAGAVRFGTTLLVENVEHIDPILNPVLNKELQRNGGRTLVRIGAEEIDYSPKFRIILSTKNPAVHLTPDVCSRVTLVNFTVTRASLQSQSLSKVVQAEKPELEKQRAALLKLQGEQNVKLRELEDQMLNKISACEGSILDDDEVVAGMEVLMTEGAQVEEQIQQSDKVMSEVHTAVAVFEPFAVICRNIFVLLEALREINPLYEFSSNTFMHILEDVLGENKRSGVDESASDKERISVLKTALFTEVAGRISRGLTSNDKIVFSMLLAKIFAPDSDAATSSSADDYISTIQSVFGPDFPWQGRDDDYFSSSGSHDPLQLFLCTAGYDVSGQIENVAREKGVDLKEIAMGSPEGFGIAESLLKSALNRGGTVLLKNIHLTTEWLNDVLVKMIQSFHDPPKGFKLMLTSELSGKLPTLLLQLSAKTVCEAPTGIRASMMRLFSRAVTNSASTDSVIQNRLYLLVSWVYAVIVERLKFPSGWSSEFSFSDADASHALRIVGDLVPRDAKSPDKVPWDSLREVLKVDAFGSKVTDPDDQSIINGLIDGTFVESSFDVDFNLVKVDGASLPLPEKTSRDECLTWIRTKIPSTTPPTWVGLNADAEIELERAKFEGITKKIQLLCEEVIE